ncbi:MAG: flagellar basal body L-ring protein FlgH [Terriglobales bacterium]
MKIGGLIRRTFALLLEIMFVAGPPSLLAKTTNNTQKDPQQTRAAYIARVQQQDQQVRVSTTMGSLWVPGGAYNELSSDYKARNVGDTVTLVVLEQTSAQSTGDVNSQRAFQTSSAITALPGKLKTGGINPLFGANSSTQLKGQGETSAGSNLTTTVTGHVIAVLPNNNLIVEAERYVVINSQHETMLVRGVLRPGDIGPNNTVPSTSLSNLEIELKGKGVVSDSIARPNPIMRTLLWLIGW